MAAKSRKDMIEEMLRDAPDDAELRYMLAMEHASSGHDDEAAKCFQQLTALSPEYAPGFHQGALALVRLNRVDEAKALLRRGIPAALKLNNQHAADEMGELLNSLE
jgi:cytochrome c-type biogenesis protein CcmH/NrfG